MTYKEARVYLDKVSKYGSVLGLDTIRELLKELGNPQDSLKFIHIAGTNGKGSVLAYTSSILSEAGYRTGRYVSPTVVSYLERIQIDGQWIDEDAFARLTEIVRDAIARMEAAGKPSPTVFEAETAIAFLYFKERNCDIVVLECGLGGAQDATNIVGNTVCAVLTTISTDHLGVIGDTLTEIATTKAGIIKPGCTVVSAVQESAVRTVIEQQAESWGCPLYVANQKELHIVSEDCFGQTISYKEYQDLYSPLPGRYQVQNLMLVLELISVLRKSGYEISQRDLWEGIRHTSWLGRFTCLSKEPLFFIDGAHNEDAAKRLRESLENYFPGKQFRYIMGVFRDKEYEKIADIMAPLAKSVRTIDLPNAERTLPATELAKVMDAHCQEGVSIVAEDSIEDAVMKTLAESERDDIIICFGSLSYLGCVAQMMEDGKASQF